MNNAIKVEHLELRMITNFYEKFKEAGGDFTSIFDDQIEACNGQAQAAVPMPNCLDDPILLQRAEVS